MGILFCAQFTLNMEKKPFQNKKIENVDHSNITNFDENTNQQQKKPTVVIDSQKNPLEIQLAQIDKAHIGANSMVNYMTFKDFDLHRYQTSYPDPEKDSISTIAISGGLGGVRDGVGKFTGQKVIDLLQKIWGYFLPDEQEKMLELLQTIQITASTQKFILDMLDKTRPHIEFQEQNILKLTRQLNQTDDPQEKESLIALKKHSETSLRAVAKGYNTQFMALAKIQQSFATLANPTPSHSFAKDLTYVANQGGKIYNKAKTTAHQNSHTIKNCVALAFPVIGYFAANMLLKH